MSEERKKIVGVNLGNWLVLEKWMQPFLFEENCAEDEVWLNRKVPAKKLRPLMKKHRDTYIEETDFAKIAAHGINAVRLPVPGSVALPAVAVGGVVAGAVFAAVAAVSGAAPAVFSAVAGACAAAVLSLGIVIRVIVEQFGRLIQSRMAAVLFREEHVCGVEPPVDTDLRVVPCDGPLALRGVAVVALVLEERLLAQYGEPVREAAGNEQLPLVLARELDGHMAAEGRRAAADVHGHVQYGTFHDAHQFPLCMFSALEMEPPQHAV